MPRIILIVSILLVIGIILFLVFKKQNKKVEEEKVVIDSSYRGMAYNNVSMYKQNEVSALKSVIYNYPAFTKETLYSSINDLIERIVKAQRYSQISINATQKATTDALLIEIRNNTKFKESIIINYESNYMNVVAIFESTDGKFYQLLCKFNVQNGLLYLDSYNSSVLNS